MKPPPFRYLNPTEVEEAAAILAEHGADAKLLAGGQSLVPMLNFRLVRPSVLVDINRITSLSFVERDGVLRLGALTRQVALEESPVVREAASLISGAMRWVGHRATRNRGTLGGSVAHADPAAELPAVLLALSAEVVVLSKERGERVIGCDGLFVGPFTTALRPDEVLAEVRIPAQPAGSRFYVNEISRRHGDFALGGVAAAVALDEEGRLSSVHLAAFGVSPVPVRLRQAEALLAGQRAEPGTFAAAAEAAQLEIEPWNDLHASADYRRRITGVLLRRALAATSCTHDAGGPAGG